MLEKENLINEVIEQVDTRIKLNYELNEDNTIRSYTIIPFNENKPFVVVDNITKIIINNTKVINGELVNDFDFQMRIKELTTPKKIKLTYQQLIQKEIRKKYSIENEIAILRQRDTKLNEYEIYNEYVESCKRKAKILVLQEN